MLDFPRRTPTIPPTAFLPLTVTLSTFLSALTLTPTILESSISPATVPTYLTFFASIPNISFSVFWSPSTMLRLIIIAPFSSFANIPKFVTSLSAEFVSERFWIEKPFPSNFPIYDESLSPPLPYRVFVEEFNEYTPVSVARSCKSMSLISL